MKAKILLSLCSVLFVCGVLEVCLRVFRVGGSEQTPEFAMDDQTGWVRAPNQSGFVYQRNPGVFNTRFQTNSRGMRDREHPVGKGSNLRILAVGDSFTEGWGVEEQQAYPKVLESHFLNGVDVWNLGVVGYSTDQELQQLRHAIPELHPDVVVLGFYENDIADNTRAKSLWYPRYRKPLFALQGEQLVLTNAKELGQQKTAEQRHQASINHRLSNVLMESAAFRLIRFSIAKALYSIHSEPGDENLELTAWQRNNSYRRAETTEMNEAWSLTDRLLGEINLLCQQNGSKFVVVYIPRAIEVVPGILQLEQKKLGINEPESAFDLAQPEHRLQEMAQRNGIHFVPMADRFRQASPERLYLTPIIQDGHLSPAGQFFVAENLAEALVQESLLPLASFRIT
jgi:lysophospholipase L1-like esterase